MIAFQRVQLKCATPHFRGDFSHAHFWMQIDEKLQRAAEAACGAGVKWQGFVPVVEPARGITGWKGVVSIFGCPNGRVYAWAVKENGEPQYVAVLGTEAITSPFDAVREWLASRSESQGCR
jgi:hypothetical protein